ncbi:PAS/PAC sensor signal transduction histidine kinase [Hymenobacter roseosalivarius DSM 11622]|uniref:histidine kinase n=1 Tax=Hymenobacter roseosalivarius DSM 11622 TaxID=645990 RepID=A0A1W1VGG5_9BACT|nr:PAS domain-containing protein [Hymenobacter roseosalivarius]SMB92452.1 PAS/PAC sensor signal transduction histidine kinase [Hymenobacter roseosalivarius DSM 11622]
MFPPAAAALAPADDLLQAILDVSLTGIIVFRPVYDPADPATITDLAYVHLNPAAQRMLQLPECPTKSFLTLYPSAVEAGIFAFYRDSFLADGPGRYDVNYQADGLDNYYRLASRRAGDRLVVSFSDTADQPRSSVEIALRESQDREKAARADAEEQRAALGRAFEQAPVPIAILRGPEFVVELANPSLGALWGRPVAPALGRPLFEALPDLAGQGLEELLTTALRTGEPVAFQERPTVLDRAQAGLPALGYYNFTYQPLHDALGQVTGLITVGIEVTEQVLARQQMEQLNQELEARVAARTQEADHARQRLDQAFRQAPFYLNLYRGPAHVFELVHPLTQALFGERVLLGRPRREALPELGEATHRPFDRAYATGEAQQQLEMRTTIDRDGDGALREVYFDIVHQPLFDAQGQVEGVLTLGVDATERVHARRQAEALHVEALAAAQRQVQEREALFHMLADTPAAVALLRKPEHRFEYVNAAYQQLFPDRQLTGRTVAEALPETKEAGFLKLLDQVYRTGETFFGVEMPMRLEPADGRPVQQVYYTFTYQAYRENDQIAGISIFAFDVTEQVQARQQREAERQQLHHLFMEAPTPIVILDGPDLVFQLVNPAYQRIFPGRTLLGRPVLEALPELSDSPVPDLLQQVYETGETYVAQELSLMLSRHDGEALEEIHFTFTYQARRNTQGAVDGLLVFAHEITDQVQARRVVEESGQQARDMAQELADANQQLIRTNVDLDNFIYTASHDLKAPIANIEGLLYLLQEELPAEVAQDAEVGPTLARMLEAVERFKRTIDHLTEVSKLQKEHAPATTLVTLATVVEDVGQDLLPQLQAAGARLLIDVSAVPPVQFAEKNLRSIVYNLLSNAVKYRHPDRTPHVDVRAHVRPGHTVLEVHDNGLGLDPAYLPRLFTMFQRFHDHVEGTGIGLYMVKRMVENAGGRIEVHSQPGAGTTFFVFLPHATSPAGHPFSALTPS